MNEEQRDELLIVIREDVKHIKGWTEEHKQVHKDEKAARWKYLSPLYAALVGVVAKVMFWN
jgi:hypothetical protein